jgi:myo-inositol-1(or 4)-monophosphatase
MGGSSEYAEWMEPASAIVREAGTLLLGGFRKGIREELKGAVDLVTEMDRRSEELLVTRLMAAFPGTSVLAEEGSGGSRGGRGLWIIDPLDGTTNYAHGFPVFAVSVGFERDGRIELGLVLDVPRGELYSAVRGGGAYRNGERLSVSTRDRVDSSLLATGFPYDIRTSDRTNLRQFASLALKARGVRRAGAAALDLAWVAAGSLDGFWEEKLHPWDVAAGVLLVEEAGGRLSGYFGEPADIRAGTLVATNGWIHDELVARLRELET